MNKKTLIDKLLDKWPAKVICLIIAIFLYIFHQVSITDKKTFVLPLNIVENGIVQHIGRVPSSVSVVIRAGSEDMSSISLSDMSASVTLDDITEPGTYDVPVFVEISDKMLALDPLEINLKDKTVKIKVDKRTSKYVPLQASITGQVARGYQISKVEINPSVVLITGPESVLKAVDFISTTKINVSNAEKTFSTEASYVETSKIYEVEEKGPYKATVIVETLPFEREFTDVTLQVLNLSENLELQSPLPKTIVKISGPMLALEAYNITSKFAQVDLTAINQPGQYTVKVKYNLPAGFDLVEKELDSVDVIITEKIIENNDDAENVENAENAENGERTGDGNGNGGEWQNPGQTSEGV